jgi:glycosyltransferase involved in cell wall biosynthesis
MVHRRNAARVVLVGRGAPELGGIPTYLQGLVDASDALGRDVRLLNLARQKPTRGGAASVANLMRTGTDALRVLRVARRGDIVHVHSALAPSVTSLRAGLLVAAARARGAHVIVHAHGGRLLISAQKPAARMLARIALTPAHLVVAVAGAVERTLTDLGLSPDRVCLLHNGVDVVRFRSEGASHAPPRVLFVGGLTERKGLLDLFEASTRLREEGLVHELWVAGGTPDEGTEAEAEVRASAPAHARLLGQVPPADMPALYAEADIFCLPSWWEATPLTVLEAQAAGLPVVATDVGDVRHLLSPEARDLLVAPMDRSALTEALGGLLRDPARRAELGAAGREHVETHFDQRIMIERLKAMYASVGETS